MSEKKKTYPLTDDGLKRLAREMGRNLRRLEKWNPKRGGEKLK